jgi:peptide/nickel transport system substrate-binding protein
MRKRIALGLLLGLCLGGIASAQEPKLGGVINAVIQPEPPGLMLAQIQNGPTQMVSGNIYEGLLRYSKTLEPLPGLAESWSVSPDAKVYTFKLKPGVTWHDGKPFTSADVLFSIEMLKQTHARARGNLMQLEKVEAPDDLTVVFTLKAPFGPFLGIFEVGSMPMIPKHLYEGTDYKTNPNNNAPIGTGPFMFKEWQKGSFIRLVKNPNYHVKGKPYIDEIYWQIIPDAAARSVAFETGKVDVLPRRLGGEFRRAPAQQAQGRLRQWRRLGVLQPAGLAVAQQPLRSHRQQESPSGHHVRHRPRLRPGRDLERARQGRHRAIGLHHQILHR